MKSSGKYLHEGKHTEPVVQRGPKLHFKLAAKLSNVQESPTRNWFWRHEEVILRSWGLLLWGIRWGHWRRCRLSCSKDPRTKGVMKRSWGLALWKVQKAWRRSSLSYTGDSSILKMTRLWDDCKGRCTGVEWSWSSLGEKLCVLQMAEPRSRTTQAFWSPEDCDCIPDFGHWATLLDFGFV